MCLIDYLDLRFGGPRATLDDNFLAGDKLRFQRRYDVFHRLDEEVSHVLTVLMLAD